MLFIQHIKNKFISDNYRYISKIYIIFSDGKASTCNVGDLGLIPGLGRSSREGKGYPLQYSGLENSMGCIVHGVTKSQIWLSDFHSLTRALVTVNSNSWAQVE